MSGENKKILIIEDEELICDLLHDFFKAKGFEVAIANDGNAAIKIIEEADFQVVLLDLKIPGVNGIELSSLLQKHNPTVPVIIMTAYPSIDTAIKAIRLNVFDYIVKPFQILDLLKKVEMAVFEQKNRESTGYIKKFNNDHTVIISAKS